MILFIIGLLVMYFLSSAVCTVCFTQANNPPHSQSGVDGLVKPIETDNYNCLYVHLGKPSKKKENENLKWTFAQLIIFIPAEIEKSPGALSLWRCCFCSPVVGV